jgi:Putative auto-transporter adhesin, head GIN domain
MKKVKIAIFIVALIIGLAFAKVFGAVLGFGFPTVSIFSGVKGSGIIKTEKREVTGFKQIDVSGAIEVEINAQNDFSVNVETDDNLLEYVKTEVSGETLKIYTKGISFRRSKVKVFISMPELTGTEVSGASKVNAQNIKTEKFTLDVSGASKIELSGEANNLTIDSSGASKINAENLKVANANVDVSGASHITVNATEEVRAEASGASKVNYVGEPKNVIKDVSGASKVSQK